MLELKVRGIAGQVVNAVHQAGFKKPVIYASFLYDELPQVQEADPDADRMALFDRLPNPSVARATRYAASCVGLRHDRAARHLIESFHRSDLRVFVYTANRLVDIERALSLGVDGII